MSSLTSFQPSLRDVTQNVIPAFKIFIACEDQAAFFQAKKVQRQVEAACDDEVRVNQVFWSFALLRHEQFRKSAATEAADADMIILSMYGHNEVPEHIRSWLAGLPKRGLNQGALVALFGPAPHSGVTQRSQVAYLRELSESLGMDFFCKQDDARANRLARPSLHEGRQNLTSHRVPWLAGGINE